MDQMRARNIFGAVALSLADEIVRAASAPAPEAGPSASALALLKHEPGLSIRTLAAGVGLSHAGAVRLVDRLVAESLIERRAHDRDGRTRSLHLTAAGEAMASSVLLARDGVVSRGLSILTPDEVAMLGALSEKILRAGVRDLDHAYRVCRLCDYGSCRGCPIEDELKDRGAL